MNRKEYKKSYAKFVASYFVGGLLAMFSIGLFFSMLLFGTGGHLLVILAVCLASFVLGMLSFLLSHGYEEDIKDYV